MRSSTKSGSSVIPAHASGLAAPVTVPVPGPEPTNPFSAVAEEEAEAAGRAVMVRPALLPRRERELRRESAPPGVEAPERDLREEAPDFVRRWWFLVAFSSKGVSEMRLVELSRLESQLWPFCSRVEDARAMPARSIHSASGLDFGPLLCGRCWCPREYEMLGWLLCVPGTWWRACPRSRLCKFVSLMGAIREELLLRAWRLRELLRECERIGGVLGTETLDR